MRCAYKYRIYPSRAQEVELLLWLDLCRSLHNSAVAERRDAWQKEKRSVSFKSQSASLPGLKKTRPEYQRVNAQVLQQALHRVDLAFKAFFRRVKTGETPGYPRFKPDDRYNSLTWPQDEGFRVEGRTLWLSKLGNVKIKLHRPVEGRPKTCTVKRTASGWYAYISCDDVLPRIYPEATTEIGIDMGLTSFATLSTGEHVDNPRWYRKSEERIAEAQRELARKKKGSKRRQKAKRRLARLCHKAAEQRRDFQHKLALRLVCENSLIAVEALEPGKMSRKSSKGLAKSILDAAWGMFLLILACKAEEAGRRFSRNEPRGTSSTCSRCGAVRQKNLSERIHRCDCGLVLDRDHNAALNILRLGRSRQVCSA
jgi:putative transposase